MGHRAGRPYHGSRTKSRWDSSHKSDIRLSSCVGILKNLVPRQSVMSKPRCVPTRRARKPCPRFDPQTML